MKSLNDLIWDEDVNLEKTKEEDSEIESQMEQTCIVDNCTGSGGNIKYPFYNPQTCRGF